MWRAQVGLPSGADRRSRCSRDLVLISLPLAKIPEEEEQEDPYLNDRCRGEMLRPVGALW